HLHADTDQLADLKRHAIEDFRIDADAVAAQRFPAQLEQNALVFAVAWRCRHESLLPFLKENGLQIEKRGPQAPCRCPVAYLLATAAATSAAKSTSSFAMPSPTSKRTNSTTSAPAFFTRLPTVTSGSLTNGWSTRLLSDRNFLMRPITIFSTMSAGLPLSAAWAV